MIHLLAAGVLMICTGCGDDTSTSLASETSTGSTSTPSDATDGSDGDESSSSSSSSSSSDVESGDDTGGQVVDPPQPEWRVSAAGASVAGLCVLSDDGIVFVGSAATIIESGSAYVQYVSPEGELGWRADFGAPDEHTFFYEVACAPDDTVYAVGIGGGTTWFDSTPLVVQLDGATGTTGWSWSPEDHTGVIMGAHADTDGVDLVGDWFVGSTHFNLARLATDGASAGAMNLSSQHGSVALDSITHSDGVVYVAGFTDGLDERAVIAALGSDGSGLWLREIPATETSAWHVVPDDVAGDVLVAGLAPATDPPFGDVVWVLRCSTNGCDDEAVRVRSTDFDGLVAHPDGTWLTTRDGDVRAHDPETGEVLWRYDTSLYRYLAAHPALLAVDGSGAILVGGRDGDIDGPPTIAKLVFTRDAGAR